MPQQNPATASDERSTVPISFLQNMLSGARRHLSAHDIDTLATQAGISPQLLRQGGARVTREQFVKMYERVALFMGDEMLGLWSRPIRAGALKYLGLSLLDAPSLMVAMYRFTRFWNLLLDDYRLRMTRAHGVATITIAPRQDSTMPTPFGHELMVKLIHGVASWLLGRQLPVQGVGFAFARPAKFDEYAKLFPGPVLFGQDASSVSFSETVLRQTFQRTRGELLDFVRRAPDDWIFVTFDHDTTTSQVRDFVAAHLASGASLGEAAASLHMSDRALSRQLAAEGTSFRAVKEEVRRDLAIQRLVKTREPIDRIAASVGFDNTPAFHRAFHAWTGSTPRGYRRRASPG
jgi:AraC-like DNA-binding protein